MTDVAPEGATPARRRLPMVAHGALARRHPAGDLRGTPTLGRKGSAAAQRNAIPSGGRRGDVLRRSLRRVPPWSLAVAAVLAVQLANALSVPVISQVGPAGTAWLRMCCGAVVLWLIARPSAGALRREDVPTVVALGIATGFMTTFFLNALERIPLGTAVAIEFLGPLTVAAVMTRRRRTLGWPLLAAAGVLLMTEPWVGDIDAAGVGYAIAAGACWGLYNVLTQRIGDRLSGISALSWTIPIAAVATAPWGVSQVAAGEMAWWVLPAVAGIALITPVFAFGLEMLALRRMTHHAFGTLLSIEPAFGIVIGLLVLAQTPALVPVIGIVLVIVAGAAAQRHGERSSDASRPVPHTDLQEHR